MKIQKKLVGLIKESEIITNPGVDDRILQDARNELEKRRQERISPIGVLWRTFMKTKKTAFATASMIVIAALAVFQFTGNTVGPSLTFAQVIEPILKAKTATYDVIFGTDDGSKPVVQDMVMGSRILRRAAGSRMLTILDLEKKQVLQLNEVSREARYIQETGFSSDQKFPKGITSGKNYLEELINSILRLKNTPEFTVEELGGKELDGRKVVGFFASHPKLEMTLWADVESGLPVHIEYSIGTMHVTYKNMKFDVPMEEEMFSMEVPAGYTVQESVSMGFETSEENFINGLRLIAEKFNNGCFPDDVSYDFFSKWMTSDSINSKFNAMSKEEAVAIGLELVKFIQFTIFYPGEGKWIYRGKGVRMGENEIPIFWYRPEKSETYHVIYGDLHVENIDPEDLPE